jgi:hypothetical protein
MGSFNVLLRMRKGHVCWGEREGRLWGHLRHWPASTATWKNYAAMRTRLQRPVITFFRCKSSARVCYIIVYIMVWCVMITFDFHFEPIVVVWYDLCFNGPFVTAAFNHAQGEDEGLNRIYGCSGRTNPWKSNGTGWQRPPLRVMENRESFPGLSGWAGHAFSLHPVR